jgi:D-lactate dehydrogenase
MPRTSFFPAPRAWPGFRPAAGEPLRAPLEEEKGVSFEDLSGQILHDDELARLLTFPNVLITAHQAFLTREALAEIARVTVANIAAFAISQPFLDGTALT